MNRRLEDRLKQFDRERELLELYLAEQGEDLRLGCPEPARCNNKNKNAERKNEYGEDF
jgi:hypothetical protein